MRVDVSARQISFPRECVCCRRPPETDFSVFERLKREAWAADEADVQRVIRKAKDEADRQAALAREERDWLTWVAKVEGAKGPAGRRAVLEKAFVAITQQHLRDRILLEASKIEVQSVLDKADGLKSPAAKLRHLEAALETLRNDDVPDELQGQQIRWLEDAIAEARKGK